MRDADRAQRLAAQRAQSQLTRQLLQIADMAAADRSTGFRLPVLDADPGDDFPTNMWGFDDGRVRWRGSDGATHELAPGYPLLSMSSHPAASSGIDIYRHSSTDELRVRRPDGTWAAYPSAAPAASGDSTQGGTATKKPRQPDPRPRKYRKDYSPTWGRAFNPQRGPESGNDLRFGYYDSTWGERRIMLGFDDAQIRADLAGAEILKVTWHMLVTDTYSHGGVRVHFGAHDSSGPPGIFSATRRNVWSGQWPDGGTGEWWRGAIPDWYGRALRDGTIRGVTIDQPSTSRLLYGEMRVSSVILRIQYAK